MERQLKHIEYSAILRAVNNKMKFAREVIFDPEYVKNHPYRPEFATSSTAFDGIRVNNLQ